MTRPRRIQQSKKSRLLVRRKKNILRKRSSGTRRVLKYIFVIAFIVFIVITTYMFFKRRLLTDPSFTVKYFKIQNNKVIPSDVIIEHSGIQQGENVFSIDLKKARHSIEKNHLIREATVKRQLPDTIAIKIYERYPVARLNTGNGVYLVDEDGVITAQNNRFTSSVLPEITGFSSQTLHVGDTLTSENIEKVLDLVVLYLESSLRNYVVLSQINMSDPRNIRLITDNSASIDIGTSSFEERMSRLIAIFKDAKKKDLRIETIDLRYNSVPIKFRETTEDTEDR